VDALDPKLSSVGFLLSKFPGKTEQEYRQHLGNFQITGQTGLQLIGTLSGGQKSRVAFAALSLARPHILLLDEPTNHLDMEGLDALIVALENFNGGVIVISHDERFVTRVGKEVRLAADRPSLATDDLQLWVCGDNKVTKFYGDVKAYKVCLSSSCPDQALLILDTESDRQQREDEAVGGSGRRRSPVAEVAWWFGCDDAIGMHEVVVAWNHLYPATFLDPSIPARSSRRSRTLSERDVAGTKPCSRMKRSTRAVSLPGDRGCRCRAERVPAIMMRLAGAYKGAIVGAVSPPPSSRPRLGPRSRLSSPFSAPQLSFFSTPAPNRPPDRSIR
jgi:hypothetical protein